MAQAVNRPPLRPECYPVEVDWARCMRELRDKGWTPYRVATEFNADPPTAYAWERGSEPGWGYGAALIALHRRECGEEYSAKLIKDARPR